MTSRQLQKADSLDDVEIAPLRPVSRSSSRSTSYISYPSSIVSDESTDGFWLLIQAYNTLIYQTIIVALFVLASWHVPRFLISIESSIGSSLPPFQVLQDGQVILNQELNHPLVDPPTIPSALLVYTSVWIPLVLIPISAWVVTRGQSLSNQLHSIHASLCAFCTAIALSEGPTQLLKLYIRRPRPNYYALCGFDTATRTCTAPLNKIREANFSFPSGHSSLSACAAVFLIWYLCGVLITIRSNNTGNNNTNNRLMMMMTTTQKRLYCFLCTVSLLSYAMFVAASRLVDFWHHHSDIVAGLCLGSLAASIAYHVWYPPIWNRHGGGIPYSLLDQGDVLEQQKKELSIHE